MSVAPDPLSQETQNSARELLMLPMEERNRILAEAAARAEDSYRTDKELTDFDAFGENDLYDETP